MEESAVRAEFGDTVGPEEAVAKKLKEWYNATPEKDFSQTSIVPATRSPLLADFREKTIRTLQQALENKDLRGDYEQVALCILVIDCGSA